MVRNTVIMFLAIKLLISAQIENPAETEIFVIDSYITPELPNTFHLSFFTSDSLKSRIVIDGKYRYPISDHFDTDHSAAIDLTNIEFDSTTVTYVLYLLDKSGNEFPSERYDVKLPDAYKIDTDRTPGFFTVCCFGGIIFGLPSPTIVISGKKTYFELLKEIPILSFYSSGYNYPESYLSVEYGYVFNAGFSSILRGGYKYVFQPDFMEYISPGLNFGTNFKGSALISPEISLGILKIQNVFTLFLKYRYNHDLGSKGTNFHEISLGLYSNFFSINL